MWFASSLRGGKQTAAEAPIWLVLCSGTDNYLADIDISRLLDRERNGASNRIRRDRDPAHPFNDRGLHLRICHRFSEVRVDEAGRDDRHAQSIAGLLAQTLGDGAYGELRAGIDRHGRYNLEPSCRSGVDEMPEPLLAEDRQRRRDAVQNAFDVDVDHLLPFLDA